MSTHKIDFVQLARDVHTESPVAILILATSDAIAQELSPDLARDTARRLVELADEWERSKPLRRLRAIEDDLRGLDG